MTRSKELRVRVDGEAVSSTELATKTGALGGVLLALIALPPSHEVCPFCGTSEEGLMVHGLAGCPLCYVVFKSQIHSRF